MTRTYQVGGHVSWRDGCGNTGNGVIERIAVDPERACAGPRAWVSGDADSHGLHDLVLISPPRAKFRVGDRVVLDGVIKRIDEGYVLSHLVYFAGGNEGRVEEHALAHPPAHDIGLLPEQLEAVTKERDDARDQLARVCAQVETHAANLIAARKDPGEKAVDLCRIREEHAELKDAYATACAGERSADAEVARLAALLNKRTSDTRVLDAIESLLGLRGGDR